VRALERVNKVLNHPLFCGEFSKINELEKDRVFCRHGMNHLADVARIAYILYLESDCGTKYPKELFYTAALLHDLGRARQDIDGTPHERESARLAEVILPECGFDSAESELILDAILSHRTATGEKPGFAGFIYRADKLSRHCVSCAAEADCDWELKNLRFEY